MGVDGQRTMWFDVGVVARTVTTSFTSVSWIPSEAISGLMRLPLDIGLGRYDQPPPERIDDLDTLLASGGCRFANRLTVWATIDDGVIRDSGSSGGGLLAATEVGPGPISVAVPAVGFPEIRSNESDEASVTYVQTAGGRTGAPYPRTTKGSRRWRLTAPTAWTTLAVTIGADGSITRDVRGASPFPRHFFYDDEGQLVSKSATIDYRSWVERHHDEDTPWGGADSEVMATATESALERTLSAVVMQHGPKPQIRTVEPGDVIMSAGEPAHSMDLILDGLVSVEVDGEIVGECGPGSLLGERAFLEEGVRTATVRAVTRVKLAQADPTTFSPEDLDRLREFHRRENEIPPSS